MDEPVELSAVIVNYNTRELTLRCIEALEADLGGLKAEIWVVDNASTDGSVAAIHARFPNVHLIENPQNLGFGAANNQAIRLARGEYLLLLNSDAFPRSGSIRCLLTFLREHLQSAIAGPKLVNADQSLQRSCYRFPSPLRGMGKFPSNGRFAESSHPRRLSRMGA